MIRKHHTGLKARKLILAVSIFLLATVLPALAAEANEDWVGTNDFGGTGLIQTRTARTAPDGMLEVGYSRAFPYKRYYVTLQGLPWLEGTFRYTEITNRLYSPFFSFSGLQTFKDRGADITLRLLEESKYYPALAVTFQDGLGTGQFAGEYLTANKRYYDLDFSFGMAWGYAASGSNMKNPLAYVSEGFNARGSSARTGGKFNITSYFSGPNVALYGGIAYRTPIQGLTFKAEYDPNDYQGEPQSNKFEKDSAINFGLYYRPFTWIETSFAVERGNVGAFRVVLRSNLHGSGMPKFDPPPPVLKSREQADNDLRKGIDEPEGPKWIWPFLDASQPEKKLQMSDQAVSDLFNAAEKSGVEINLVQVKERKLQIEFSRPPSNGPDFDIEKFATLASNITPNSFDRVQLLTAGNERQVGQIQNFESGEIQNVKIVDFLFDSLEKEGFALEGISLNHNNADVSVTRIVDGAELSAKAAKLIMDSIPTPVQKILLKMMVSGFEVDRREFFRSEVVREANLETLFDYFEIEGYQMKELEFSGKTSRIEVKSETRLTTENLVSLASVVGDVSETDIDELTVIHTDTFNNKTDTSVIRQSDLTEGSVWAIASGSEDSPKTMVPEWTEAEQAYIAEYLSSELTKVKFSTAAVVVEGWTVTVYGSSRAYRQVAKTLGRSFRAMANSLPPEIEELSIVTMGSGIELNKITIRRKDLERAISHNGSLEELWATTKFEGQNPGIFYPENAQTNTGRFPSISWTINPKIKNHLGGPGQFLLYQFFVSAGFDIGLWRGLGITARASRNIYDNFDKIRFGSSSLLPHVRSDVREYLQEVNVLAVDRFQANYIFSPMKDWYARVSGGIFETMFGGYSSEILYKPFKSRFAIGVDINKVWQREYEQGFKFRDYKVVTGHLNTYYELPWYELVFGVHTGRYLAGDKGSTFTAVREYDGGVKFGVWATFTNVPAEIFGEGSFDKGFYITIPFETFLTKSTTRRGTFGFRPITRDGGARVGVLGRLHGLASSGGIKNVMHDWHRFLD
jgi:hypothetical protein